MTDQNKTLFLYNFLWSVIVKMLLRLVFLTLIESLVTRVSSSSNCPTDMLAVYSLSLKTEWSEKTFPKQYPQWRPSAQWSKTIGEKCSCQSCNDLRKIRRFLRCSSPQGKTGIDILKTFGFNRPRQCPLNQRFLN